MRSHAGTGWWIAETMPPYFVASDVVAIIGESKYPLRAVATDIFTNPSGHPIPFMRDTAGRIVAFKEHGDTFARLSTIIGAEARQLLVPRPPGPDGLPQRYKCTPPPALTDGIRVGEMGPGRLSCAVAEQVVNGVFDGTYPDVHAIAVHHKGALVPHLLLHPQITPPASPFG